MLGVGVHGCLGQSWGVLWAHLSLCISRGRCLALSSGCALSTCGLEYLRCAAGASEVGGEVANPASSGLGQGSTHAGWPWTLTG